MFIILSEIIAVEQQVKNLHLKLTCREEFLHANILKFAVCTVTIRNVWSYDEEKDYVQSNEITSSVRWGTPVAITTTSAADTWKD